MENQIVNFLDFNFEGKDVRIVDKEGNPWFVAKDVCAILGLSNTSKACESLDDDEKHDITISDSMGRLQKTLIISESGLYQLVFKSRKPESKKFTKWVTKELVPQVRKTGSYGSCNYVSNAEKSFFERNLDIVERLLTLYENDPRDDLLLAVTLAQNTTEHILSGSKPAIIKPTSISDDRRLTRKLLNNYAIKNKMLHGSLWPYLYKKFEQQFQIKITGLYMRPLDYVESIGMMKDLKELAEDLFQTE